MRQGRSAATARLRVFLADDHEVVRTGFVAMLGTQPELNVLGIAGDGAAALRVLFDLDPRAVEAVTRAAPEQEGSR